MTRCTPCTLCETDHKLTAVLRLRSTRLGLLSMSSTRALSLRGLQSCVEQSWDGRIVSLRALTRFWITSGRRIKVNVAFGIKYHSDRAGKPVRDGDA